MTKSSNWLLVLIITAALIFVIIGLVYPFYDFGWLKDKYDTIDHVSAFFSLASVLLFVAALIFQSREYRLQVEELKKSVEAQTKASAALEEQKAILLEQRDHSLIFNMIQSFNENKGKSEMQDAIDRCYNRYISYYVEYSKKIHSDLDEKVETLKLAKYIKDSISYIHTDDEYFIVRRYVIFAHNLFYLVDQKNLSEKSFTPFIHNQLSKKEILVLYLAALVDYGMGVYDNLEWNFHIASEFIYTIEGSLENNFFNPLILTEELNRLRRK